MDTYIVGVPKMDTPNLISPTIDVLIMTTPILKARIMDVSKIDNPNLGDAHYE